MTNETIGHYASHPGGGTVGWNKDKGFHGDIRVGANQLNKIQPSDLELRIRKDVMDAMEELKSFEDEFEDETEIYFNNLLNKVIDRLKLLWGE